MSLHNYVLRSGKIVVHRVRRIDTGTTQLADVTGSVAVPPPAGNEIGGITLQGRDSLSGRLGNGNGDLRT